LLKRLDKLLHPLDQRPFGIEAPFAD